MLLAEEINNIFTEQTATYQVFRKITQYVDIKIQQLTLQTRKSEEWMAQFTSALGNTWIHTAWILVKSS